MPQYARIKLTSANVEQLDRIAWEIKGIAEKAGVKEHRPATSPYEDTQDFYEESPHGEGTHTFDHWQLRIHRRLIHVEPNERAMRQVTRLTIPEDVRIELTLVS